MALHRVMDRAGAIAGFGCRHGLKDAIAAWYLAACSGAATSQHQAPWTGHCPAKSMDRAQAPILMESTSQPTQRLELRVNI